MPYKRKYRKKKYPVRRRRRRPHTRHKNTLSVGRMLPDSTIVTLTYGDIVQINPNAAFSTAYVFRANSIFDPDRTGTGHQPLGRDEWSNFYNHVTVLGSRIKATFVPRGSTATTSSGLVAITLKANDTVSVDPITPLLEAKGAKWAYMGLGNATAKGTTLRNYFSAKKFFGVTDVNDNNDLKAAVGFNPAEQAYFHVQVGPQDGLADAQPIDVIVQIDYICRYQERKTLLQS